MKQQRIERATPQKAPQIIDNRQPKATPLPEINLETANQPVRAVFLMEVRDMTPEQIQYMIQEAAKMYENAKGGIHYVLPVRNGKLGSDVIFEKEWLDRIKELCEVKNGEIAFKDNYKEVTVVRQYIPLD